MQNKIKKTLIMFMLWAILMGQGNTKPIPVTSAKIINTGAISLKYVKICVNVYLFVKAMLTMR
jgi:hypothetical protein